MGNKQTHVPVTVETRERLRLLRSEIVRDAGKDSTMIDRVSSIHALIDFLIDHYQASASGHDSFIADLHTIQKADKDLSGLSQHDVDELRVVSDRLFHYIGSTQAEQSVVIQAIGRLNFRIAEREINNE